MDSDYHFGIFKLFLCSMYNESPDWCNVIYYSDYSFVWARVHVHVLVFVLTAVVPKVYWTWLDIQSSKETSVKVVPYTTGR